MISDTLSDVPTPQLASGLNFALEKIEIVDLYCTAQFLIFFTNIFTYHFVVCTHQLTCCNAEDVLH